VTWAWTGTDLDPAPAGHQSRSPRVRVADLRPGPAASGPVRRQQRDQGPHHALGV